MRWENLDKDILYLTINLSCLLVQVYLVIWNKRLLRRIRYGLHLHRKLVNEFRHEVTEHIKKHSQNGGS